MTISYKQAIRYSPLRTNSMEISNFIKAYPIDCRYNVDDGNSLFGIEVEVENVPDIPNVVPIWSVTEDGSLRNNGREFVSRPIKARYIEYALRQLFRELRNVSNYDFSRRTSIHVHCNIRLMTPETLWGMLMTYLVVEKLLFRFVGHDRYDNIHCVPLCESNVLSELNEIIMLRASPGQWHKYTAVNLVPISDRGTVEFRHMHGTDDVDKLMKWVQMILKMKMYSYRNGMDYVKNRIYALNSNSAYINFVNEVFGEFADDLLNGLSYEEIKTLIEGNVALTKLVNGDRSVQFSWYDTDPESAFAKAIGYSKKIEVRRRIMDEFLDEPDPPGPVEVAQPNPVHEGWPFTTAATAQQAQQIQSLQQVLQQQMNASTATMTWANVTTTGDNF